MGLNVPDLDRLEYEEVFEEARRQIPVHTDEWTDHNAHDTGIAILEMLAWLSETYSYQLDRITDEEREKHLQLLGVERRPPEPATAELSVTPPPGADGVVIPAGTKLVTDDRSGVERHFETMVDETLVEADLEMVVTNAGDDTVNNTTEAKTENTHFYAFGGDPQPGDALYLGFDADPFESAETLELTIDFHDEDLPEPATHGDRPNRFEPSVDLDWQYCTDYEHWDFEPSWASLEVVEDTTNALYQGGIIRLEEPLDWTIDTEAVEQASVLGQRSGLVWIRCRVETPGYEIPPRLNAILLNVLDVSHRNTIEDELLTRADETLETTIESNQTFAFRNAPVIEADVVVDGEAWTEVQDFDASTPSDRHYVLDNQAGAITFGDGINGAKPPLGEHVVAERYVHGGGTDGNVTEQTDWEFDHGGAQLTDGIGYDDVEIEPMGPATGGTDMESVDEAIDRFRRDLKRTYRASTLEDYSYVAKHTPGVRFGRAYATTQVRETTHGMEVEEIKVVVVPYSTQSRPQPSEGFIDAVTEHLNRNRLVTDPVRVHEPTYVTVGADIVVSALPGYTDAEVSQKIRDRLYEYLHPVTGFDGDGWPFGQPLYATEVEDIVAALPSVQSVERVTLTASGDEEIDDYGNVLIPETALLTASMDDISVSMAESDGRRRHR
jgi:predicted phage baseplate assembly protein